MCNWPVTDKVSIMNNYTWLHKTHKLQYNNKLSIHKMALKSKNIHACQNPPLSKNFKLNFV